MATQSAAEFQTITTEKIGLTLQHCTSPESIDYFYLQIRSSKPHINVQEINQITQGFLFSLPHQWKKVIPANVWPSLFFGYFPKQTGETDRDQEARLNKTIRMKLKIELEKKLAESVKEPTITVHILMSRACNYFGSEKESAEVSTCLEPFEDLPPITTEEIGYTLKYKLPDDDTIDYFFLQIQNKLTASKTEETNKQIQEFFRNLPQNNFYLKFEPWEDWPSIYFVPFNKLPAETEREQEKRLNRDVRMELKKILEEIPSVHIMITRVCKYTDCLEREEDSDDEDV